MPTWPVSLAILVAWTVAASSLLIRDVLPNWILGPPPNMRTVAGTVVDESPAPVRWVIQVGDAQSEGGLRSVGKVVTSSSRRKDGTVRLDSEASFDSSLFLRGLGVEGGPGESIRVAGLCEVDPTGNLDFFRVSVREGVGARADLLTIDGRLSSGAIQVNSRGVLPMLNSSYRLPYPARGVVQDAMGPIDRMPNLHVGQRWESRIISPLTGRVESCAVEVKGRSTIIWGDQAVTALEVVAHLSPVSTRTWVHADSGLVLRQEVPFPFARIVLERVADPPATAAPDAPGGATR